MENMYSTKQVSRLSGASLRQLQWWDETGLLQPLGKVGNSRVYTVEQMNQAKKIVAILDAGGTLKNAREGSQKEFKDVVRLSAGQVITIGNTLVVSRL